MAAWILVAVVATSDFCASPISGGVQEPDFCRLDQATEIETPYFSVRVEPELLVGVHREGRRLFAQPSPRQAPASFAIDVLEQDDSRRWANCPAVFETTEHGTTWRECQVRSQYSFEKRIGTQVGNNWVIVEYSYSALGTPLSPALERMLQSVRVIKRSDDADRSKQRLLWPLAVVNERIIRGCLFNESIADERESVYGAGDQVIALAPNGEPPFALVNPGNGNVKLRPSQPLRFPMYQCLAGEPFRTAWQADGLSIRLDLQAVEPGEESCLFEGQVAVTRDARSGELPIKGACGC